jgi:hypothetical protein
VLHLSKLLPALPVKNMCAPAEKNFFLNFKTEAAKKWGK